MVATRRSRSLGGAPARWWPFELVMPKRAPVPWVLAAQAAAAVGGAFGAGVLSGHTADGLLASLGCLPAVNADRGGPYRLRLRRMVASGVAAVLGIVIGSAVRGEGWVVVVVAAVVAAAAGTVSGIGAVGSLVGLNVLVYVAISSTDPLPTPTWRTAAVALAGVAWAVVVTVPGYLSQRTAPERLAVAAAYDAIADLLGAAGSEEGYDRRRALTAALNQAEDALVAARTAGRLDLASVQLLGSLHEAGHLSRVAVDRLAAGRPAGAGSVAAVRHLAALVRSGGAPDVEQVGDEPADADVSQACDRARRAVTGELPSGERSETPSAARRWAAVAQRVPGRRSAEATVRLVVCMVVAEALSVDVLHARPYWVPLTVAVSMKPDFGSVFARAAQRALGTAVGVVVGGTILVVIGDTRQLVPFLVVLAALLPVTIVRNYGMFVTVLTPLVLILIDSLDPQPGQLVTARLADTLVGCGIVVVLGHLIWPSTWKPRLLGDLAVALDAVGAYLRAAAVADEPATVRRRNAYRALSDVRTSLARHFADPSPLGAQARVLWPGVAALEEALDATVRLADDTSDQAGARAQLHAAADSLALIGAGHPTAGAGGGAGRRARTAQCSVEPAQAGAGPAQPSDTVSADRVARQAHIDSVLLDRIADVAASVDRLGAVGVGRARRGAPGGPGATREERKGGRRRRPGDRS